MFQVFQAENNVMKQFSTITTLSTTKINAKIMPHADSDRKLVVVNDILVVVPPPHPTTMSVMPQSWPWQ